MDYLFVPSQNKFETVYFVGISVNRAVREYLKVLNRGRGGRKIGRKRLTNEQYNKALEIALNRALQPTGRIARARES